MEKADVKELKNIVGDENVRNGQTNANIYELDTSLLDYGSAHLIVVKPEKIEHVQDIMRYADLKKIPVIVRGSGTGYWKHFEPYDRTIVLDMKKMDKILEISLPDLYCRVEPGVIDDDLNDVLKPYGIFYPPGPISSRLASIGGEIANNTSGLRSIKYGSVRDSVLGMKIVLANGDLISLGFKTRMEVSDYQIDRLMVGSEGTLGIIVEVTLKLVAIPHFRGVGFVKFRKLEDAGVALCHIMSSGVRPSSIELLDKVAIDAVSKTLDLDLNDVETILLFEADGGVKESVFYEIGKIIEVCGKNKGFGIEISYDFDEFNGNIAGDKKLLPMLFRYKKVLAYSTFIDVAAVICSNMVECVRKIQEISERHHVIMSTYGNYGSDCMHIKVLMNPVDERHRDDGKRAATEVHEYIRSIYSTISAEQDDMLTKIFFGKKETMDSFNLMRRVKKAFDPKNILNSYKFQDITA